ncbi:NotI family restriction endonuclease [Marispirochaeta sp.]|uniref:NotI family restriction endonuclease n=1 Tax=Marispirochaeta sp. TaxID=2038653 RepID=UPI0029C604B1|nr:NotI family restriction endonuclease [Marispirochaeta sp.]
MSKIIELFGNNTYSRKVDWNDVLKTQICPFTKKKCFKVRKSQPEISIGTCIVLYGKENKNVIICPNRLLENNKVFLDCIHLLRLHEPGNDIHIVPEVGIPGGNIDYILASVKDNKVVDFVGIEFQTLDTTGTVWPYRQEFLKNKGFEVAEPDLNKSFGMNWKMTAKTILVQLHHKIETFEHLGKHLVLIIQDNFLAYMKKEFNFREVHNPALPGDSLHLHAYSANGTDSISLKMEERMSTDSVGIAKFLGLNAEAQVEFETIVDNIRRKISSDTLLVL